MSFYLMGEYFKEKPTISNTLAVVYCMHEHPYCNVEAILSVNQVINHLRSSIYEIDVEPTYRRICYLLPTFELTVRRSSDCGDLQGFFSSASNLRNSMLHLK